MKRLVSFCASMAVCGAFAEATFANKEGAAELAGSGVYNLSEPAAVDSLLLNAASSDELGMKGAALNFTTGGLINFCPGAYTFNNSVAAAGSLTFTQVSDDSKLVTMVTDGFIPKTPSSVVIAENENINECSIKVAIADGSSMSPLQGSAYTICFVTRGDGWLEAQLQLADSAWAKCLKVRLVQDGVNIKATVLYARYATKDYFGQDFDGSEVPWTGNGVATYAEYSGYGVRGIVLVREVDNGSNFTFKDLALAGALTTSERSTVTIDGGENFAPSSIALGDASKLVITNRGEYAFAPMTGENNTIIFGGNSQTITSGGSVAQADMILTTTWQVAAENQSILSLESISDIFFLGLAIPRGDGCTAYNLKIDPVTMTGTAQAQILAGDWIKCVCIKLRQTGKNVEICAESPTYYTAAGSGLGVDMKSLTLVSGTPGTGTAATYTLATNADTYGYGVQGFTLNFKSETITSDTSAAAQFAFNAENSMSGAAIYQYGGMTTVTHLNGLPTGGGVYHVVGGRLILACPSTTIYNGISSGAIEIHVENGGVLQVDKANNLDTMRQKVTLDGSSLELIPNVSDSNLDGRISKHDGLCYVNQLTLKNGSHVTHHWPRLAYTGSQGAIWHVCGTGVSTAKGMIPASTSGHIITMTVDDTTNDAAADFIVEEGIIAYNDEHSNFTIIKDGAGTMLINGTADWKHPMNLKAGTLMLGNAVSRDYTPFNLNGGTLAVDANNANTVGAVQLSADSTIAVGEGATLIATPDSSNWTADKRLTVTGPIRLRAANRATLKLTDITAEQLAQIRWLDENNHLCKVRVAPDGSLAPIPDATLFIVK